MDNPKYCFSFGQHNHSVRFAQISAGTSGYQQQTISSHSDQPVEPHTVCGPQDYPDKHVWSEFNLFDMWTEID